MFSILKNYFLKLSIVALLLLFPVVVYAEENITVENILDMLPGIISKINLEGIDEASLPVLEDQKFILDAKATDKLDIQEPKNIEEKFVVVSYPVNTFVLEEKPCLKWLPDDTDIDYRIKIMDTMNEIYSDSVSKPECNMPETFKKLKRGKFYFWSVKPEKAKTAFSPHVYFYIASDKENKDITGIVKELEKALKDENCDCKDLIIASFYDSKGYYGEAEKLYKSVLNRTENAELKNKVKLYLTNMYLKSERPQDARTIFATVNY